jgi:hypothetical protein
MRRFTDALVLVVLAAVCAAAICGCGSSANKPITHPYCWPSGCAKITGHVVECGGPPPGRCQTVGFVQVALLDSRGRLVTAEHSGTAGRRLRRFTLLYNGSGRYTVETKLIGVRATKQVRLRRDRTLNVRLVIPIS